jgi:uncharacterized phage protein (TIGR02218 family)
MSKTVYVYHFLFPAGSGRGPYRLIGMGRKITTSGVDGDTIPFAVGGGTFEHTPSSVSHSRLVHEGVVKKQTVTVTLPLSDPLAQELSVGGVVAGISVTIFVVDLDDPVDSSLGRAVVWKGRVTGISNKETSTQIEVESLMTRLRREANRARYSRTCRHALYGPGCGVLRSAFQETKTIDAVSEEGQKLTLSDFTGDFSLSGGLVDYLGSLYYILDYTSGVATLDRPSDIPVGASVTVNPGCERTPGACLRFNNIENYGGFPFIPRDNPFQLNELV